MGYLPDIGYPQTGDIAEPHTYVCMGCEDNGNDQNIIVLTSKEKLPPCSNCGPTYWFQM